MRFRRQQDGSAAASLPTAGWGWLPCLASSRAAVGYCAAAHPSTRCSELHACQGLAFTFMRKLGAGITLETGHGLVIRKIATGKGSSARHFDGRHVAGPAGPVSPFTLRASSLHQQTHCKCDRSANASHTCQPACTGHGPVGREQSQSTALRCAAAGVQALAPTGAPLGSGLPRWCSRWPLPAWASPWASPRWVGTGWGHLGWAARHALLLRLGLVHWRHRQLQPHCCAAAAE